LPTNSVNNNIPNGTRLPQEYLMKVNPIEDKHIAPLVIIISGILFLIGMGLFL
jgi:hypothetical protein